jgi:hypothetical protein
MGRCSALRRADAEDVENAGEDFTGAGGDKHAVGKRVVVLEEGFGEFFTGSVTLADVGAGGGTGVFAQVNLGEVREAVVEGAAGVERKGMLLKVPTGALGVGVAGLGVVEAVVESAAFPDQTDVVFPRLAFGVEFERVVAVAVFEEIESDGGELVGRGGVAGRAGGGFTPRPRGDREKLRRGENAQRCDEEQAVFFHDGYFLGFGLVS